MRGMIKREVREKIEKILQRIKYRTYQAYIALQSHDKERLEDMARRIRINGKKIDTVLGKKKRKAAGNGRSRKKRKV